MNNIHEESLENFHRMEEKYKLFEIGKDIEFPFWDMIRVYVYNTYIIKVTDDGPSESFSMLDKVKSALSLLKNGFPVIFKRRKNIIVSYPRYRYNDNYNYDRISHQLAEIIDPSKRLILNLCNDKQTLLRGYSLSFWEHIFRVFVKTPIIDNDGIDKILNAINDSYGHDLISISTLRKMYVYHYKKINSVSTIIKFLNPDRIICAHDMQKHIIYAGRINKIPTYEMQHAGIVFDYPSYSYPSSITSKSNIAFADYYLMFGSKWGQHNNIPANKIVIGNDSFLPNSFKKPFDNKFILIISDCLHSEKLVECANEMAARHKDRLIVIKLHPSEPQDQNLYYHNNIEGENIKIVGAEYSLWDLIKYMDLMILVYSSSFFEALSLNKKVAVLKYDNYYALNEFLKSSSYVAVVENWDEIDKLLLQKEAKEITSFFSPFDKEVAERIISSEI